MHVIDRSRWFCLGFPCSSETFNISTRIVRLCILHLYVDIVVGMLVFLSTFPHMIIQYEGRRIMVKIDDIVPKYLGSVGSVYLFIDDLQRHYALDSN